MEVGISLSLDYGLRRGDVFAFCSHKKRARDAERPGQLARAFNMSGSPVGPLYAPLGKGVVTSTGDRWAGPRPAQSTRPEFSIPHLETPG